MRFQQLALRGVLALVAACNTVSSEPGIGVPGGDGGEIGSGGAGGTTGSGGGLLSGKVDVAVDTNRDGSIDATQDENGEDSWVAERGAVFLANLDDDDTDEIRDADDDVVGGEEDEKDLAKILVRGLSGGTSQASGLLTIGERAGENVRIFKKDGSAWTLILGSLGLCDKWTACNVVTEATLSASEVSAGVELGLEARSFRVSTASGAWDGRVTVHYEVTREGAGLGQDSVELRVAPWLMFGNLSPHDQVWSHNFSSEFVDGVKEAADAKGMAYRTYGAFNDIWTQDFFQTGWTAMPGAGGSVQGMRVGNARPWGRTKKDNDLPIAWLTKNYLGPDRAVIETYDQTHTGNTFDSHGNHDLLPPYGPYPQGRLILGSEILSETTDFYSAQEVQGEPLRVDSSWLVVGHIDEVFSYLPATNALGWKLLVHSPSNMLSILQEFVEAGHGSKQFFVGKGRYNDDDEFVDAAISVDEILVDEDLLAWSQEAEENIQGMLEIVTAEVDLADTDIVQIPVMFESLGNWGMVAWNPGHANLLAFGDTIVVAKPFGPQASGADLFEAKLTAMLTGNSLGSTGGGMNVFYTDDWQYHISLGEVHCGTNIEASSPYSTVPLWEVSP